MKILHVYKCALPDSIGGVESCIDSLATNQVKAGHTVNVLATTKKETHQYLHPAGYTVYFIHASKTIASTPFALKFFFVFMKLKKNSDIIHCHYPYPFMDLCLVFQSVQVPIVVTYHSDIIRQNILNLIYTPLKTLFLRKVSCIVGTSPSYVESSKVLKAYKQKTRIISLGLRDLAVEKVSEMPAHKRRNRYILFLGQFRYYKGLKYLFDAAPSVDCDIVVAGGNKKALAAAVQAQKKQLSNVHVVGVVSFQEKIKLLAEAFALVLPSHLRTEAFGLALLEGQMFSKPLITCEIGTGTSYVNLNSKTGLVVRPRSGAALAAAINILLKEEEMATAMGRMGRTRYETLFTDKIMHDSYMKLYSELIGEELSASEANL